jgi:hypothetical protein
VTVVGRMAVIHAEPAAAVAVEQLDEADPGLVRRSRRREQVAIAGKRLAGGVRRGGDRAVRLDPAPAEGGEEAADGPDTVPAAGGTARGEAVEVRRSGSAFGCLQRLACALQLVPALRYREAVLLEEVAAVERAGW